MLQGEAGRAGMVEDDVRHAGHFAVARNSHARDINAVRKNRVHGDQSFYRALLQKKRIFGYELIPVVVADHKIKIALLQKMILNPGHDQGSVSLADFGNHNTNRETALLPERPGEMIGPVIQFARGGTNQFLGALRNRFCSRRPVDHEGNSGLRQAKVLCEMP
jgi:hypothetical protein